MTGDPSAQLRTRLAALPARLRAETAEAFAAAGEAAVTEARRLLASSAGPLPSRPGSPPRDGPGHLAATLGATVDPAGSVTVVAAAPARFLEYGTSTMASRPFLRPAAAAAEPAARAALRQALNRAARQERGP